VQLSGSISAVSSLLCSRWFSPFSGCNPGSTAGVLCAHLSVLGTIKSPPPVCFRFSLPSIASSDCPSLIVSPLHLNCLPHQIKAEGCCCARYTPEICSPLVLSVTQPLAGILLYLINRITSSSSYPYQSSSLLLYNMAPPEPSAGMPTLSSSLVSPSFCFRRLIVPRLFVLANARKKTPSPSL
jgi:hypothetical protein